MRLDNFIKRPVLSTVISILTVILGLIGLVSLPMEQYPDVAPPTVSVSANYQGANAQTVLNSVIVPLEEQINGVEGMTYMTSTATNEGSGRITVFFKQGMNADMCQVNVQNRVSQASALLPAEVTQAGVTVQKRQTSTVLLMSIVGDPERYDEKFLQNYADINIIPALKRVNGVGDCEVMGAKTYSMRIWLDPIKMKNYGLMPSDISGVLAEQNIEAAPGKFGEQSDNQYEYTIRYRGRLQTPTEFENMVISSDANGNTIRVKDVARVELGGLYYSVTSKVDGKPAVMMMVTQTAGSNATQIVNDIKNVIDQQRELLPPGVEIKYMQDVTEFLYASIDNLVHTLFEAFVLVFIVVFLFLQDFRSTLIPLIAVPVSLVGTFFFLYVFGFSLNLLTLLGLILAIGIVVDDAIVVVENVDRIMNEEHLSPYEATKKAMRSLSSALIAMSLVLCAVFVPVSFLSGITGQLYRQFTITIAVSVVISTIVALTLSPVMCSLFLRPDDGHRKNRFFRRINLGLAIGNNFYGRTIARALANSRRMFAAFGIVLIGMWLMNRLLPQSFMPQEDQGYFTVELELPEGATIERTRTVANRAIDFLMADPDVEYVLNVTGSSPRVGTNQAHSQLTVILKPWDERETDDLSEIMGRVRRELSRYPESKVYLSTPPVIPGLGQSGGFEMVLEARGNTTYTELQQAVDTLMTIASQRPELTGLASSMQGDIPQLYFDVDRDKAQMVGVSMSDIFSTMKAFTGSIYVNDFNMFNRIYRVYVQAEAPYRAYRDNLNLFFVRGDDGAMIPITALGTTYYTTGPGTIKRFNMFNSATISGEAAHGYSSGQAMDELEQIVRRELPASVGVEWSGLSYQEKHEGGQTGTVLALAFLFVFLFLAAQYESWTVPIAVILSLPVAGIGAYLGIWICGLENNIYFQIGLVMLVGLVAKNAILIVEFAKEEVEKGRDVVSAAITAAHLRFRPIVMTSLAFILGLLPLVFASGPGSASRQGIGTGVFFGMLVAITVGIVFVPFFFVWIYRIKAKLKR